MMRLRWLGRPFLEEGSHLCAHHCRNCVDHQFSVALQLINILGVGAEIFNSTRVSPVCHGEEEEKKKKKKKKKK